MEINELQIGDWVEVGGIPRQIKLIDDCINHKIIAHGVNKDGRMVAYVGKLNEEVKPIPLTPEVLEKNGFELKEEEIGMYGVTIVSHYICDGVPFEVFCDGEPFAIWFKEPVNIKFVHQLQHALRLCGIEEEITL
jgi:hypothetical protein